MQITKYKKVVNIFFTQEEFCALKYVFKKYLEAEDSVCSNTVLRQPYIDMDAGTQQVLRDMATKLM